MSFDVQAIAKAMIEAARTAVPDRWPQLAVLADVELGRLAHSLADLALKVAGGQIRETHARQLAHMHQVAARNVLQTLEGIALLTAEQTIQAGIRAVTERVNGAVKFKLL